MNTSLLNWFCVAFFTIKTLVTSFHSTSLLTCVLDFNFSLVTSLLPLSTSLLLLLRITSKSISTSVLLLHLSLIYLYFNRVCPVIEESVSFSSDEDGHRSSFRNVAF
jgi:hypothetical protein